MRGGRGGARTGAVFALDPEALDGAAGRIAAAAASLTGLEVARPILEAGAALPGSETSDACLMTGTRLEAAVDDWATGLVELCETARAVARDAAETDAGVAEDYRTGAP